jgi:hypothetical protein
VKINMPNILGIVLPSARPPWLDRQDQQVPRSNPAYVSSHGTRHRGWRFRHGIMTVPVSWTSRTPAHVKPGQLGGFVVTVFLHRPRQARSGAVATEARSGVILSQARAVTLLRT